MRSYESPKMSLKSYLFILTLKDDIMEVAMSMNPIRNANFVSVDNAVLLDYHDRVLQSSHFTFQE
jgi:hypothetical protein